MLSYGNLLRKHHNCSAKPSSEFCRLALWNHRVPRQSDQGEKDYNLVDDHDHDGDQYNHKGGLQKKGPFS